MIVVTGASGRIGRSLQFLCQTEGILDMKFQTRQVTSRAGDNWFQWKTGEPSSAADWNNVRTVIHLAGTTPTTGPTLSLTEQTQVNVNLVLEVLEIAKFHNIARVLIASSASVYGPSSPGVPFLEGDALQPMNDYARTKMEMERAVSDWNETPANQPEISILRIGNIAGADQLLQNAFHKSGSTPLLLDQFPSGKGPLRSYIGPLTLAKVLRHLATYEGKLPLLMNVSGPVPHRMENILRMLSEYQPVKWEFSPASGTAIEEVVLATDVLEEIYAFSESQSSTRCLIEESRSIFLKGKRDA